MKKNIVLAVIATAAMALSLVGCGVKVTNISVPDAATLEKGESITLPVNFGTEDAPAETPVIATGESATAETAAQDEKIAKAAEKLTLAWTSSDESVATVDETGTVTAVAAGEAEITAAVKDTEMQDVCVITVKVSAKELKVPDTMEVKLNDTDETAIEAKCEPEDASNISFDFASSDEEVATVDKDGKVTGVNILSHSETAGLGANAVKESFRDQFVGLVKGITVSKDKPGENSIDALTGATVTSRAVTKAVNAAIEAAGGENDG